MENNNINDKAEFNGRLCNFEELVKESEGQQINIVVPKIQRPYAQGRKREKNIRESFVSQILNSLAKGEDMELNFVYGSRRRGEYDTTFELLDGQQRLTTLFLFYWYFSMVEGDGNIPEFLKHFSYETRTTSAGFIEKLVATTIDVTKDYPRNSIRGKKWYTTAYDKDATIEGMLIMLDTIHEKYCAMEKPSGMLANLSKIKFYELPLENFGLTEEIYIKMNARGLQLTPFENFKADLMKYMKDEQNPNYKEEVEMEILNKTKAPYYLSFIQKMDAKWIDLFWSKDDKDDRAYSDRFFRFFYRYIATKYFLEVNTEAAKSFRTNKTPKWEFLHETSEKQSSDAENVYLGFDVYKRILDQHPEYIKNIEVILDTIQNDDYLKGLVFGNELKSPWDNDEMHFFEVEKEYTLPTAVMFCAITEYIEASNGTIYKDNLTRWLRVVWNCIEDQLFRNVNELVSLGRNLRDIIRMSGATNDLYHAMVSMTDSEARAIKEEKLKAKVIDGQPTMDWEDAFINAESHQFFRGSIGWFLFADPPATPNDFRHRTEIIGSMFDGNGIVKELRETHTLVIAMLRQLNDPDKIELNTQNGYICLNITENRSKKGDPDHLRSLLNGKEAIQQMFCHIGDMKTREDAIKYIGSIMSAPISFDTTSINDSLLKTKISKAFQRLATDTKIYDFIEANEDDGHAVAFAYIYNSDYVVHVSSSPYRKLYISSERREIISELKKIDYLLGKEQYLWKNLWKKSQDDLFVVYGDYLGNCVCLMKKISEKTQIKVNFVQANSSKSSNAIEVYVLNPSDAFLYSYTDHNEKDEKGWFLVKEIEYDTIADYNDIVKQIQEIEQLYSAS